MARHFTAVEDRELTWDYWEIKTSTKLDQLERRLRLDIWKLTPSSGRVKSSYKDGVPLELDGLYSNNRPDILSFYPQSLAPSKLASALEKRGVAELMWT